MKKEVKFDGPLKRVKETIFIPLPRALWRPTGGNCHCPVCKGTPGFWDTLAVSQTAPTSGHDYAHTVHYPELHQTTKGNSNG